MRSSMAYFAGAGTVIAAIAAGLGGGLLISNIVSPHAPRTELSRLELRMSERPILATNAPSEPVENEVSPQAKPVEAHATKAQATENVTASAPAAKRETETSAR